MLIRRAEQADLAVILALLRDDSLGAAREGAALSAYLVAFEAIRRNPDQHLLVGERDGQVVATCQLTLLPGLSRGGMTRALIEAVRVDSRLRSAGLGARLIAEAERIARDNGAGLIQLTSDSTRTRAHGFYLRLGYEQSHLGFKKLL